MQNCENGHGRFYYNNKVNVKYKTYRRVTQRKGVIRERKILKVQIVRRPQIEYNTNKSE